MQRRHFICSTVLGTLGATMLRATGTRVAPTSVGPKGQRGPVLLKGSADNLRTSPADVGALNLISSFSNRALFSGGCVGGKSGLGNFRSSHIIARISDLPSYQSFLTQSNNINGDGMCIGNSVCFNYLQTTFELEALLSDDFDKRLSDIQAGKRADGSAMIYAYEALLYEPAKKQLTDPFRAMAGTLAQLKRIVTPSGYADLAEGNLAIPTYRLMSSPRDQADLTACLNQPVSAANDARTVTAAFLQNLSLNSQVNTMATIVTLCGSRLVRNAVQTTLGCDSIRVAGNFARLRAVIGPDTTDGTIWHAMFQTAEVPPDGIPKAANLALAGGCKLKTFLTMQEFQRVGLVKKSNGFKMYA